MPSLQKATKDLFSLVGWFRVNIVETMALFIGCYIFLEHILATPSLVDDEIITLHSHTNTLISTFLVIEH